MKRIIVMLALALCASAQAQDIANTLGGGGSFTVKDSANTFMTTQQSTGFTGLGTNATAPRAQLEVGGYDGLLSTGTLGSGTALNLGSGTRLHWYPRKAAFRAGVAEGNSWDDDSIGNYSIAMGYHPRATAAHSVALGQNTKATGIGAVAIGNGAVASGNNSIAIGGPNANTAGFSGAVHICDNSYEREDMYSIADNTISMKFSGGDGTLNLPAYQFFTGDGPWLGVEMRRGDSGWSSVSDRNRKENFRELDGEDVLRKIRGMPVTEWTYKWVPQKKYIGPMAQDFFAAFGLCGTDSLCINTICMDGVNMAGVRALEKRTSEMRAEIERLNQRIEAQQIALDEMRRQLSTMAK